MCHYITMTFRREAEIEKIKGIAEVFKFGWKVYDNASLFRQLPGVTSLVLTARKSCDCGTELGSKFVDQSVKSLSYDREIKKFRKKGWSVTKIKRWLEQKETYGSERGHITPSKPGKEIENWMSFIQIILESNYSKSVGLLLFWHTKLPIHGQIELVRIDRPVFTEISGEYLQKIEENVLYEFHLGVTPKK